MIVLVAGGAGLLGSRVARRLRDRRDTVVVADVFDDSGDGRAVKEARAEELEALGAVVSRTDLTDFALTRELFERHRPAAVLNAGTFDGEALSNAALQAGIGFFLHLSAAALYGPHADPGRRASEDEEIAPAGDAVLLRQAADEARVAGLGLPYAILRVFDLVGPGLPIGRFPMEALEALLANEDIYLPDDEPRDLVHVEDAATGVVLALDRRPMGRIVNLGSGMGTRPRTLLEAMGREAGLTPRILFTGEAGRPRRIADMENAWNVLGFAPRWGLSRMATDVLSTRMAPRESAAPVRRVSLPGPEAPKAVSRRELFDLFRRK